MLQHLSWGNYLTAIVALTSCYYLAVALLYYRPELKALLQPNRRSSEPLGYYGAQSEATDPSEDLKETVDKLNSILETAGTTVSKEELLPQLNQVLTNYAGLRIPAYRGAVFNHILKKAKDIGIDLQVDELGSGG